MPPRAISPRRRQRPADVATDSTGLVASAMYGPVRSSAGVAAAGATSDGVRSGSLGDDMGIPSVTLR